MEANVMALVVAANGWVVGREYGSCFLQAEFHLQFIAVYGFLFSSLE